MKKELLNIRETAEMLGISTDTLRNWDNEGKLIAIRTAGNHRRYRLEDISKMLDSDKECRCKGSLLEDKTVVYCYVCGDILHRGHILHLKNSKSMGDFLIVGVLTDEAVMEKKPMPLIKFEERIELVECLKMVDMVVPQHEYAPHVNVLNLKPDILMESTSHDDELVEESKKCIESIGGKLIISSYYPDQSSTNIKNKIKEREQK